MATATESKRRGRPRGSKNKKTLARMQQDAALSMNQQQPAARPDPAKLNYGHRAAWFFNLLFLIFSVGVTFQQLSEVFGQLSSLLTVGLVIGAALALLLFSVLQRQGTKTAFAFALRINAVVLLGGILLASYTLWRGLLQGAELVIANQTVMLFLLLGLCSTSALLQIISSRLRAEVPLEQRIKQLMGGPSLLLSFCVGVILSCLLMLLFYIVDADSSLVFLKTKFLERGIIPPLCLVLFFWCGMLLLGKYSLSSLNIRDAGANQSAPRLLELWQAYKQRSPASQDLADKFVELIWQANDTFYIFPRYINWAIPILGFIGTVLGISLAAGEIGNIVGSSSSSIGDSIGAAMEPLGIAFDTTLIALSLSVFLAFTYTLLQRWEEQKFLFVAEFIQKSK